MEDYKQIIADNLKKLREERKLSLDKVAKLSGLSKSMIAQIEKGEVNPSISTVWKLASGFKISFTELMNTPQREVEIIRKSDISPITEDSDRFKNHPVVHFDPERRFEIYLIDVEEGGEIKASPHVEGTIEYVIVNHGKLRVTVGSKGYDLGEGDTIRFKADTDHEYKNIGEGECKFNNIIYYERI